MPLQIGLLQYPMIVASEVTFDGNYTVMNALLLVVALLPLIFTFRYGSYFTAVSVGTDNSSAGAGRSTFLAGQDKRKASMSPALILSSPGHQMVSSIRRVRKLHNTDEEWT